MAAFWVHSRKELTRKSLALPTVTGHHVCERLPRHLGQLVYGYRVILPSLCTLSQLIHVGVVDVRQVAERAVWETDARAVRLAYLYIVSAEHLLEFLHETAAGLLVAEASAAYQTSEVGVGHQRFGKGKEQAQRLPSARTSAAEHHVYVGAGEHLLERRVRLKDFGFYVTLLF